MKSASEKPIVVGKRENTLDLFIYKFSSSMYLLQDLRHSWVAFLQRKQTIRDHPGLSNVTFQND